MMMVEETRDKELANSVIWGEKAQWNTAYDLEKKMDAKFGHLTHKIEHALADI